MRFETPAGRQGQVDFGTFTLPWGRRHALVVVLSHSRLLWLRFYRRQTMAVLTAALESAFERFGGVPMELLFDQMRAVVLSDDRVGGGELVLNAEFLRFAAHWGFHQWTTPTLAGASALAASLKRPDDPTGQWTRVTPTTRVPKTRAQLVSSSTGRRAVGWLLTAAWAERRGGRTVRPRES